MATPRAAIRYAKSLFSLAEEQGSIDAMEQDVRTLHATIEAAEDLELMLQSPVIKADAKEKILVKIFEGHISDLSLEFVKLLVRKGRESILPAIMLESQGLIRSKRNIRVAEVIIFSNFSILSSLLVNLSSCSIFLFSVAFNLSRRDS